MKLVNYYYDSTVYSMARAATVRNNRVEWTRDTYVDFNKDGNVISITNIHVGMCEWETIFFSDSFDSLKDNYKSILAAAALALNVTVVKVGRDLVTVIYDLSVAVERKPEPLTNQPYAISGHRKETPRETQINVEVPDIKITGKGAWGVVLGLAVVACVGIAVAANRN